MIFFCWIEKKLSSILLHPYLNHYFISLILMVLSKARRLGTEGEGAWRQLSPQAAHSLAGGREDCVIVFRRKSKFKMCCQENSGGREAGESTLPMESADLHKGIENEHLGRPGAGHFKAWKSRGAVSWGKQPCSGTAIYAGPLQLGKRWSCLLGRPTSR